MIGGSVLREGSNNAFEREDWIRIGYENGEWNGWCVERSVGWNTMHVFPYVRCLPILDKNTLTNIADIGRESVHDINKIRARRTGTRTKTRILVFLRLCFIFSFFFFGITIPSLDSFDNLFFFCIRANGFVRSRDWALRHTDIEIKRKGVRTKRNNA